MDGVSPHTVQVSRLQMKGKRTPYSERFDDIYFTEDYGLDESKYVYLEGNFLPAKFTQDQPSGHTVGEIGFGVGLNFLLTLQLFREISRPTQKLYYFSAEAFPVHREDLKKLYDLYPELKPDSDALLEQYPLLTPGFHALPFLNGRVILYLMLGSAESCFSQITTPIQSWYWDGFTPQKNPEAFSESLFNLLASISATGATGTSFTAATWVRKGLEKAGFEVIKRAGFGKKRECIRGTYLRPHTPDSSTPWYATSLSTPIQPSQNEIAVAGAGLAGSAIANSLARRGFTVTVYDPNGVASRASGNKAGLFDVQLSRIPSPLSRFAQASLARFLRELDQRSIPIHYGIYRSDGVDALALTASNYPDDFFSREGDGVFLPSCGFLNPGQLCKERLNHPLIQVRQESLPTARAKTTHVIYAQGADLKLNDQIMHSVLNAIPTRSIRGQILEIHPSDRSRDFDRTQISRGYVTPVNLAITGSPMHVLGATYLAKVERPDQTQLDTEALIHLARATWPQFKELTPEQVIRARVGYRLSTPDKLPLIGPLADPQWLKTHYRKALQGSRRENLPDLQTLPGEWCLLGLGSRGITFSSLGADILASLMVGEPLPIERDLWAHLHAVRFFIRNIIRNTVD